MKKKRSLFLPLREQIWLMMGDVPKHREQVKKQKKKCQKPPDGSSPDGWSSWTEESVPCGARGAWSKSSSISFCSVSFVPFMLRLCREALTCKLLLWWPAWQLRCQEVWVFWGPCTVNHKFFSVGTYFLPLKTLRDHFSYFGEGESYKRPSHCTD